MSSPSLDSFKSRKTLKVGSTSYSYFSLPDAEAHGLPGLSRLPFSLKVLVENLLRHEDGRSVRAEDIRAVMLERRTQTNEPGRCATLLPILSRLPQPLALLEVGAAAGLCLLPDRYGYDYGDRRVAPSVVDAPVFPCRADAATPIPIQPLRIAWRLGLDLHPLDVANAEHAAWLETMLSCALLPEDPGTC